MVAPTCPWNAARLYHVLLTRRLLRTANHGVPSCLSHIVLLDVAQLRRRRPIHDKPNGYLRFAALVTKPGEKYGLPPLGDKDRRVFSRSIVLHLKMEVGTG